MSNAIRNAFQRPTPPAVLHVEHTSREELARRTQRLFHAHHTRTRTQKVNGSTPPLFAALTVGGALERLSPSSLHMLCVQRDVTARSAADRRAALAGTYGDAWRGLLADLRRRQLVELLAGNFPLSGRNYGMPPMSRMNREQLKLNVEALFEGLMVPPDMVVVPEQTRAGSGEEDLLASLDEGWSRPRPLAEMLKLAGLAVPQRLQTARFRELLHRLKVMGVDVQLEDGTWCTMDAQSPGLGARVRIRRAAVLPDLPEDEGGTNVVVIPSLRTLAGHAPAGEVPYESALLRLQFLTAVPCMQRAASANWPQAFLDESTRGLALSMTSLRLLRLCAATFARGGHDALASLQLLKARFSQEDVEALCAAFVRLNPLQSDATAHILNAAGVALPQTNTRSLGALEDLLF